MADLLSHVALQANRYLRGLDGRPVAPSQQALDCLTVLDEPLAEGPTDPEAVFDLLDRVGSRPRSPALAGASSDSCTAAVCPRRWPPTGWPGPGTRTRLLCGTSPIASRLEEVAQRWLVELLDLPEACGAAFVSGDTMANFTCLAAARTAMLERLGWDVESDGLFGAPPFTVVIGEETHPSVTKALGLLGLGRRRVIRVPSITRAVCAPRRFPPWARPPLYVCRPAM